MPNSRVQILEQQRSLLVDGVRKLYKKLQDGENWPGAPVELHGGHPRIQDILERLGVISPDSAIKREDFEEQFTPQVPPTFTLHPQQLASSTPFEIGMDLNPSYDPPMDFEHNQHNQFTTSPMSFGEFSDDEFDSFINNPQAMASEVRKD